MEVFSSVLSSHAQLQTRYEHSKEFLAEVRGAISGLGCGRLSEVCIFAAGSLGRFETGRRSDLDVFLIAHSASRTAHSRTVTRLDEIEIFADLIRLNENLRLPRFSGDGRFLKIHELEDLVNATGDSSRDDSENLFTTRLLLLLESQSLSNDSLYDMAMTRVLEHYFRDGKGRRDFKPLFLLNDILRYWRTLCLNYERERTLVKPWWKKNLNLRFSRKLTVFSTVLAIVADHIKTIDDFAVFARRVPLERLASSLDRLGDESLLRPFSQLLDDYESFLAAKSDAHLDQNDLSAIDDLRRKAENFADFFDVAFHSQNLKKSLVRYVMI